MSEVPRAVGPAYETSKGGNRAGGTCDEAALAISNGEPELQSGLVVKEEARARQGRHPACGGIESGFTILDSLGLRHR